MIVVFHDAVNYKTIGELIDETDLPVGLAVCDVHNIPYWFLVKYRDRVEFIDHSIDHGYRYETTRNMEWMDWSFNEWSDQLYARTGYWSKRFYSREGLITYGYLGPCFIDPRIEVLDSHPHAKYVIGYISGWGDIGYPVWYLENGRYVKFYAWTLSFDDWALDELKARFLWQRERGIPMVTMRHPHTLDNEYTEIRDFLLWAKTYPDVWISLPHVQARWHLFRYGIQKGI
jgi:hypothetical protein